MVNISIKVSGKKRNINCADKDCPKRTCWHPHDCPVQGAGGVRESKARWMCLTNVNRGCPYPIPAPNDMVTLSQHNTGD